MKNSSFRIDFQPSFRETIVSRGDDAWTNDLSIFFLLYTKLSFVHFLVSCFVSSQSISLSFLCFSLVTIKARQKMGDRIPLVFFFFIFSPLPL